MSPEGPHFLGIGAQRAGTTWVHAMLAGNPRIWMPPFKELHHFDRARTPGRARIDGRIFVRSRLRNWGATLRRAARGEAAPREDLLAMARFDLEAAAGLPRAARYRRLFRRAARAGRITGEITPAYATLTPEEVRRVREEGGADLRVFLVLRDPVDRMLSQLSKDAGPGADRLAFLDSEPCRARTRYARTLETWREVFGEGQVMVVFFEDIAERPVELVAQLERFLGAERAGPAAALPPSNSYREAGAEPPEDLRRRLAEISLEETERLLAILPGGPPERWRARAERLLAEAAPPRRAAG